MAKEPVTVAPGDTLAQTKLQAEGFRRLPVVRDGKLIGILSEYDIRRYLDTLDSTLVAVAMTPGLVTVSPSATLEHAVALVKGNEIGALPVVEHGHLIGIITPSNVWFPEPKPLPEWVKH